MRRLTFSLLAILVILATVQGAVAEVYWLSEFDLSEPASTGNTGSGSTTTVGADGQATTTFSYEQSGTTFTVKGKITNPANGERIDGIIELQADKIGEFLSFTTPSKNVCNADTPWNVHGRVVVEPGQTQEFELNSDIAELGDGAYDFYLVSVTQCCPGCESTEPFGWKKYVARGVTFGEVTEIGTVQCTYDYQCAEKLNAASSDVKCFNAATAKSFCAKTNDNSGEELNLTRLVLWGSVILVILGIVGLIVAVKKK